MHSNVRRSAERPDRPEKRFLGQVVGAGRIGEIGDQPPHIALRGLDELRERGAVTPTGGFGEMSNLVIIVTCRHECRD